MIVTLDARARPCEIHGYHQPAPIWTHQHHVIPKAWTDQLGLPESRLAVLCPHGHDTLHDALRRALRGESFSGGAALRSLVAEALAFAAAHPNVRTMAIEP